MGSVNSRWGVPFHRPKHSSEGSCEKTTSEHATCEQPCKTNRSVRMAARPKHAATKPSISNRRLGGGL
eukprot:3686711-Prymnesium_polylepis.1